MKNPPSRFAMRWLVSGLGLWIAAALLGDKINYGGRLSVIIIAGFLLAVINTILKPIVVIFSLPAILFSLGLFVIVINGLMVLLASKVYPSFSVDGLGAAMIAGIIIGFVNYLVSTILEDRQKA
jgi:putative membrane protein